jgi:hypothetical protein
MQRGRLPEHLISGCSQQAEAGRQMDKPTSFATLGALERRSAPAQLALAEHLRPCAPLHCGLWECGWRVACGSHGRGFLVWQLLHLWSPRADGGDPFTPRAAFGLPARRRRLWQWREQVGSCNGTCAEADRNGYLTEGV